MTLYARLDKGGKGERVLCGVPICRGIIARTVFFPELREHDDGAKETVRTRTVLFGPGWLPRERDGVWDLTTHARKRGPDGSLAERQRVTPARDDFWGPARPDIVEHFPRSLPVDAVCPECGTRSTLDQEHLGLAMDIPRDAVGARTVSVEAAGRAVPVRRPKNWVFW